MSERTKRRVLILVILTLVASALALTVAAASKQGAREIVLISKDMAFYLPGNDSPNPTLEVAPGEAVRLTLINEDRGFLHNWEVAALRRATEWIPGDGSRSSVVFTAPTDRGDHEYVCSTHAVMMRGRLVVR